MTRAEILTLVALASSSYPSMQTRDPRPIVQAWSVMLADMDAVLAKTAIIKVCRESQFFPSGGLRRSIFIDVPFIDSLLTEVAQI